MKFYYWRSHIYFWLVVAGWEVKGALVPSPQACSDEQLKRCADNADPLYKDADLVVPDNTRAVSKFCSLWGELTSCIKSYTTRCMTKQQKTEFDRAFRDPVVSMSTLCQDQDYRKEYLNHAPCVKKISTQGNYCGNQYRYLIDLISGGSANIKQICCARAKFRTCITQKTPNKCDSRVTQFNVNSGSSSPSKGHEVFNATTLALSTLDKSFSIVAQQCASLSTLHDTDCPGINQSTWRGTNRGSHAGPELLDSAESNNNGDLAHSTNFQLDQPRPSKYGSQQRQGGTMQTPSRSTYQQTGEKPKTDKLSSSGSGRSNNNPQKRGSEYESGNSGGVSFVNFVGVNHSRFLLTFGFMWMLFSLNHFSYSSWPFIFV